MPSQLEDYALTDVDSLRAWLGEEEAEEQACIEAINGISELVHLYLERQLLPLEEDVTKRFLYDGDSGLLDLSGTELRLTAADGTPSVPVITAYADMHAAEQVVLAAASGTSEASYRLHPLGGTKEGTYLTLLLPRLSFKTLSSAEYVVDEEDKLVEISIAGDWGANVVPSGVRLATNIAAAEAYANPEAGEERRIGALTVDSDPDDDWAFGLSRRVRRMLRPWRR